MASRARLLALAAAVAVCAIAAGAMAPHSPAALSNFAATLGPAAPATLLAAWIALTPALFPGTVLAAAGGLLFGPTAGTAVSVTGALAGSVAAFALARRGGGFVRVRPGRVRTIRERLERRGFLTVLVLRAAPGIPATLLNYAAGLSRIRLRDFVAGVALGGSPRVAAYALLGGSLAHPTSGPALAALAVLGVVSGAALAIGLTARRALASPG